MCLSDLHEGVPGSGPSVRELPCGVVVSRAISVSPSEVVSVSPDRVLARDVYFPKQRPDARPVAVNQGVTPLEGVGIVVTGGMVRVIPEGTRPAPGHPPIPRKVGRPH